MRASRYFNRLAVLLAVAGQLSSVDLQAQSDNDFFESNVVDNFTVPVVEKPAAGYGYFPKVADKKKLEEALKQGIDPTPAAPQTTNSPHIASSDEVPSSAQDVLAAYGDPGKDVPVLAQENAPKPFKAMMAAFEVGDDKLAYGYARQWVRYMNHLQQRTSRVVQAARAAQHGEEAVQNGSESSNRIKQMIVNDNANLAANLDPHAQEILEQARVAEGLTEQKDTNNQEQQEVKERQEVRRQIAGRIPADPEGKVDVYVFFAPNDPSAEKFSVVANQIYQRVTTLSKANFAGFYAARFNSDALIRERNRLNLSFDLLVGDTFAKELQLAKFPAVVLVSPTSGKVIKEVGDKPFFYYDELIAAVQGRVQ